MKAAENEPNHLINSLEEKGLQRIDSRFKITTVKENTGQNILNGNLTNNGKDGLRKHAKEVIHNYDLDRTAPYDLNNANDIPQPQLTKRVSLHETLPKVEHYKDILSLDKAFKRPSLSDLHESGARALFQKPRGIQSDATEDLQRGISKGAKFGWFKGVTVRCTLNIWGVMLFLRLSWIVGQAGIGLASIIVLLSVTVTMITSMSMSAICTNGEVKGGGAYFMISRSLGPEFGGAIGIIFSLANAIAISMNVVGLAESVVEIIQSSTGTLFGISPINWVRIVGCICVIFLLAVALAGMEWESKAQIVFLIILVVSFANYFIGTGLPAKMSEEAKGFAGYKAYLFRENFGPDFRRESFFSIFAIYFPSATGILAGANISGDLKDAQKAIPKGTFTAIIITALSYLAMIWTIGACGIRAASGSVPQLLEGLNNSSPGAIPFYQQGSALRSCDLTHKCKYGLLYDYHFVELASGVAGIIMAGIFSATLSSAMACLIGASKVFQALCRDKLFPGIHVFAVGSKKNDDPVRAYFLSFTIGILFVLLGDLNVIAPIISNFFLMAYALINYSCFHASISKSVGFRPGFKYYNRWISLFGGILCLVAMLLIKWWAALITLVAVLFLYFYIRIKKPDVNWGSSTQAHIYKDALDSIFRLNETEEHVKTFRPQILALTGDPRIRPSFVDFSNMFTKNISLLICGHVIKPLADDEVFSVDTRAVYNSLNNRRIKALYNCTISSSFKDGARALMEISGLGRLAPNIIMMGYKMDWRTIDIKDVEQYFNVIHDAFDMRFAVGILRVKEGLDCSALLFKDDAKKLISLRRSTYVDYNRTEDSYYNTSFVYDDDPGIDKFKPRIAASLAAGSGSTIFSPFGTASDQQVAEPRRPNGLSRIKSSSSRRYHNKSSKSGQRHISNWRSFFTGSRLATKSTHINKNRDIEATIPANGGKDDPNAGVDGFLPSTIIVDEGTSNEDKLKTVPSTNLVKQIMSGSKMSLFTGSTWCLKPSDKILDSPGKASSAPKLMPALGKHLGFATKRNSLSEPNLYDTNAEVSQALNSTKAFEPHDSSYHKSLVQDKTLSTGDSTDSAISRHQHSPLKSTMAKVSRIWGGRRQDKDILRTPNVSSPEHGSPPHVSFSQRLTKRGDKQKSTTFGVGRRHRLKSTVTQANKYDKNNAPEQGGRERAGSDVRTGRTRRISLPALRYFGSSSSSSSTSSSESEIMGLGQDHEYFIPDFVPTAASGSGHHVSRRGDKQHHHHHGHRLSGLSRIDSDSNSSGPAPEATGLPVPTIVSAAPVPELPPSKTRYTKADQLVGYGLGPDYALQPNHESHSFDGGVQLVLSNTVPSIRDVSTTSQLLKTGFSLMDLRPGFLSKERPDAVPSLSSYSSQLRVSGEPHGTTGSMLNLVKGAVGPKKLLANKRGKGRSSLPLRRRSDDAGLVGSSFGGLGGIGSKNGSNILRISESNELNQDETHSVTKTYDGIVPEKDASNPPENDSPTTTAKPAERLRAAEVKSIIGRFRHKYTQGTIDVWWLFDDGGLTILLPFIMSQRKIWRNCQMRVFAITKDKKELDLVHQNFGAMLTKFRIDYSHVIVLPDIHKSPYPRTILKFEKIVEKYRVESSDSPNYEPGMITDADYNANQGKTFRHIRLHEMLMQHSSSANIIFMTLPIPRKGSCPSALYMSWLEMITCDLNPPILLLRGNQQSVLTFYS